MVEQSCFSEFALEKLIGNSLEVIESEAFSESKLTQINLKNVRSIGNDAFYGTSLGFIKNNLLEKL